VESLLQGKTGAVVVVDPKTGFILASASNPDFNPNAFVGGLSRDVWAGIVENPWRPMENKVTRGEYPPASTYKIITAAAGLEEGVIDARTTFYCKGFIRYGDRRFRCWKRGGHGKTDVVRALAESCDVFFYHTGMKLGVDRLAKYAEGFGLGKKTGFDVGFEADGLVPTASWKKQKTGVAWQGGETLSIAIGQSYNLVTPLQMAMLTAAVENGGTLLRPQAILRIVDSEGNIVHRAEREVTGRIPVGPETMTLIRKGLWHVVNGSKGTARIARLNDIEISGKTGTAQVISRTTAENRREADSVKYLPHAWFIAYAENRGRSIAAAVLVEHGEHGSAAAAPIARDLIRFYFGGPRTVAARTEETERR
jgi:penicillin-binding protein 2